MPLTEREIRTIVDSISAELDRDGRAARPSAGATAGPADASPFPRVADPGTPIPRIRSSSEGLGIFETVDEAVAAARAAQSGIRTLELRDRIIANQRRRLGEAAAALAEEAVAETRLGNVR
ncbi:MAG TPA: hypothetical protein VFM44_01070, partial [Gemmatimonadota bacterium]|nr:hypothetical protein [Gemmatimonadota bacterium]